MDSMNWVWAVIALSAGIVFGEVAGRVVRSTMIRSSRSRDTATARALPTAIFWASVLVGLVLAAATLRPSAIDGLGRRLGHTIPDLIIAAIWLIGGYAVSVVIATAIGESALKATGVRQLALERVLRITIMVAAIAGALNEMGVSSDIVLVFVATGVIGPAVVVTALTIIGGRDVASQVAAGRVIIHHVRLGQRIVCMGTAGTVVGMHSTCIELEADDGTISIIPNQQLLSVGFSSSHKQPSTP